MNAEANTEDKQFWCNAAEQDERAFAVNRLFQLGLAGSVNVDKRTNPYTHDLFVQWPSDLKNVRTPLFKAKELHGIDPQYAVTFNVKDGERYRRLYPNIVVIFDVNWEETTRKIGETVYRVEPMHVTYAGFLDDISNAVKAGGNQRINYQKRVDDTLGNAKASWVFDVRLLQQVGDVA